MTIASVARHEYEPKKPGAEPDRVLLLTFAETRLPLGLNKTNARTIASLYGSNANAWVGRTITLFPTTTTDDNGQVVDCIRIRPLVPSPTVGAILDAQPTPASTPPPHDPRTGEVTQAAAGAAAGATWGAAQQTTAPPRGTWG